MNSMQFTACAVTNEIDLNKIAAKCNIPKKYTWEEPLVLKDRVLCTILKKDEVADQQILVFSFGSIVFINISDSDALSFLDYLKSFNIEIDMNNWKKYSDDYELRVGGSEEIELNDKYAIISDFEVFYPELVATVIAKSVALEKTEVQLGNIFDKLESMIDRLEKGRLRIGEKELARTTAKVARHEYNTINYIMILDKPDITWTDSRAADFYEKMSVFFELNDRYEILKSKTGILSNIVSGFSSINHSMRGLFVEWIIVILIVFEVILMLAELFR